MLHTFVSNACRIIVCRYCTVTELSCKCCVDFFPLPLLPLDHNNAQWEVSFNIEDGSEEGKSCSSASHWPWSVFMPQSCSVADHNVNKSLNCPFDPSAIAETPLHCGTHYVGCWKKELVRVDSDVPPLGLPNKVISWDSSSVYNGITCIKPYLSNRVLEGVYRTKPDRGDTDARRSAWVICSAPS